MFISISLFLLASTISIFTSSNLRAALGEWKAFYVEPILVFLMIISVRNTRCNTPLTPLKGGDLLCKVSITSPLEGGRGVFHVIISALILSGFITSLLAIYQHYTGFMVPHAFWANRDTYRVTAWYGFPNGVGLFLAPLIPLSLYVIIKKFNLVKESILSYKKQVTNKSQKINHNLEIGNLVLFVTCILFLITGPLAIVYAKSTGGLIGVVAGIGLLLVYYKKTRWPTIIIGVIGLFSLLGISSLSSLKQEILFQDRSGQIRISIYKETRELLKDHPLAGAGLASYSKKIAPYHTLVNGERIEIFHHPHNIFLTMWVNLGLLGLVGFILILISFFKIGITHIMNHITHNNKTIFVISSMVTLITTGLVDSPYIKNDLAILFWAIVALIIIQTSAKSTTK
ncbi:MAG: O-antigen ligase family protein [Candidatus Magasanikbacteria bacterium]|nr:O-antigen ligase family protein [Candidatus Magasanikbacteria bacterium]